jgi:hypothetical protein
MLLSSLCVIVPSTPAALPTEKQADHILCIQETTTIHGYLFQSHNITAAAIANFEYVADHSDSHNTFSGTLTVQQV